MNPECKLPDAKKVHDLASSRTELRIDNALMAIREGIHASAREGKFSYTIELGDAQIVKYVLDIIYSEKMNEGYIINVVLNEEGLSFSW